MIPEVDPPLSEQQKRDFCAAMLQRYGLHMHPDNELLPVLYLAYHTALITQNTNASAQEAIREIIREFQKSALDKIAKLETRQVHFKDAKQAFWYSFAWPGLPLIIIAVLLLLGWLWVVYRQEILQRRKEKTSHLSYLLDHAVLNQKQINDSTTAHFIHLYPADDYQQARAGRHFIYEETCNCIEIPLFFTGKK